MGITHNINFDRLRRQVRQGVGFGMRDLTLWVKSNIQKENPVKSGRSRAAWAQKFNFNTLRGTVGNNVEYIRRVAEGPKKRTRPLSPKERKNLGFHVRGANRAARRSSELMARGLKRAGVPIQ